MRADERLYRRLVECLRRIARPVCQHVYIGHRAEELWKSGFRLSWDVRRARVYDLPSA